MRDYLLLYVNGKQQKVCGDDAFQPLSTFLRYQKGAIGTKVVCEEGDCGACSVLLGQIENNELNYRAVNSCIKFMYQLDCTHIVTIEGLKPPGNDRLNPVQEAMVACHGSQCGYCTPGFVVTMCGMFDKKEPLCEQEIRDGLTGNLCRCTGYEPIIQAGLHVDSSQIKSLHELYPSESMLAELTTHGSQPVSIQTAEHKFFSPVTVSDAITFKAQNKPATIVAGGTDVSVYWNKRDVKPQTLMSVSRIAQMRQLSVTASEMSVGAGVSLSELEQVIRDRIPQLANILWLFGSPQIRNAGTLAGNIANGSPIADSLPFLFVMDAEVELGGAKGLRRVNINKFYKGYKQPDMAADEVITRIVIPLPQSQDLLKLYKVSRRRHLDISAFTAAFRLQLDGQTIASAKVAYGGVAPVVLRLSKTEDFLKGKRFDLAVMQQAGEIALSEIAPISDVRGSSDYRLALAKNILQKLYYETEAERTLACRQ